MKFKKWKSLLALVVGLGILSLMFVEPAFAGTDTTFGSAAVANSGPVYTISNWLKGSLGVLLSIIALVIAFFSILGGKLIFLAGAVGTAIAIQVGPGVIIGMFTATLPLAI